MPLASKVSSQFGALVQFHGGNLFHENAVHVTDANPSHLYGEVMGGSNPIRITHQEGILSVYCACTFFSDTGRCIHLWAAILEADKRGVLGEAQKGGALRVVRDADAAEAAWLEKDEIRLEKDEIRLISKNSETTWNISEPWDDATGTLKVTGAIPETSWDIIAWDRVSLRVGTRVGSFVSASPLQISLPEQFSELKKQVECYKKNAAVVSMPRGFIELFQPLKQKFYINLIGGSIPPVVLRPLDRRTPPANHYALCQGAVWMSASPLNPEKWAASVDRAMQDSESAAFERFIGQDYVKSALLERIQRARKFGVALPHIMLHGAAEMGKSTIAQVIAQALDVGFAAVSADDLSDGKALAGMLSRARFRQILFLADIENLRRPVLDRLLEPICRFEVQNQVGSSSGARPNEPPMPQFTLVASTTRLWRVDERLRRWFVPYEFGPYSPADIGLILAALGREHHLIITNDAARELAAYCKGTPGNALVLVRRLATECVDLVRPELTASGALKALSLLGYGRSYPQSLRLIDQITSMSGIEFEQWVANLFLAAGWDTEQTPATGDHGIDLVVHRGGSKSVVQCKRWLDPIGEPVVRDMYGALMSFGARHGFVIAPTTFTEQALKFAAGKPISLVGIEELIAWSKQPDSFNPEG